MVWETEDMVTHEIIMRCFLGQVIVIVISYKQTQELDNFVSVGESYSLCCENSDNALSWHDSLELQRRLEEGKEEA